MMLLRDARQRDVLNWVIATFGQADSAPEQRALRFAEEAIEFVHAVGISKDELLKLLDYVYERPAGSVAQEVGCVGLTLLWFCASVGLSAEREEQRELSRVLLRSKEHFQERHAAKAAAGVALPPESPVRTEPSDVDGWWAIAPPDSTTTLVAFVAGGRVVVSTAGHTGHLFGPLKSQWEGWGWSVLRASPTAPSPGIDEKDDIAP